MRSIAICDCRPVCEIQYLSQKQGRSILYRYLQVVAYILHRHSCYPIGNSMVYRLLIRPRSRVKLCAILRTTQWSELKVCSHNHSGRIYIKVLFVPCCHPKASKEKEGSYPVASCCNGTLSHPRPQKQDHTSKRLRSPLMPIT